MEIARLFIEIDRAPTLSFIGFGTISTLVYIVLH